MTTAADDLARAELLGMKWAAHALRNHDALGRVLEEIETARAVVFPVEYQFSNSDLATAKNDRDALRRFRFWLGGRIAVALKNAKAVP